MTSRVFDLQRQDEIAAAAARSASAAMRRPRSRGIKPILLASLLIVPLAGAADGPDGLYAAAAAAVIVMACAALVGPRIAWGKTTLILAAIGIVAPRQPWPQIGPALFAATTLAAVVWAATRDTSRRRRVDRRPRPGTPGHAAQVMIGVSGERYVGRVLANELPQEYALLNGLKLPRSAGDIDHVVVGPSGVFLLETKTMPGHIVCQPDGTWHRTRVGRAGGKYDAYIGDPAKQVQRNIFAVRQALHQRLPDLFSSTGLWLEGLVVFPHPRTELQAEASRVPAVVLEDVTRRICLHVPRRVLRREEIDAIVAALLEEARSQPSPFTRQSAQALAEIAIVLPVVLLLVFGTIGVSRVGLYRTAAIAVAHEAARAAALAESPTDAIDRMQQRAQLVAPGLGLDAHQVVLEWDVSRFDGDPGQVLARVKYPVELSDLPLVGGLPPLEIQAEHVEWVDPFRSGLSPQSEAGR
jgi:hypothetical protein